MYYINYLDIWQSLLLIAELQFDIDTTEEIALAQAQLVIPANDVARDQPTILAGNEADEEQVMSYQEWSETEVSITYLCVH